MSDGNLAHWISLRRAFEGSDRPLQVVVGDTADASCALKTFAKLLRGNRVQFETHPLERYGQLAAVAAHAAENLDDDETDTYVLIGCGASADVPRLFDMTKVSSVHVIDSQRPVHLANLRHPQLVMWDRDDIVTAVDKFFAVHSRKRSGHRRPGRNLDDNEDDFSDATSESSDASDDDDDAPRVDWMHVGVPPRLEHLYYGGFWHGQAAAMTAFDLAVGLGQQQDEVVWNAAIGIADLHMRHGISDAAYAVEYHKLADAAKQGLAARRTLVDQSNLPQSSRSTGSWRLRSSSDYRLFALNHTSLWQAMELDSDMAAKLGIHRGTEGNDVLSSLFARVGISHNNAKREWSQLPSDVRTSTMARLVDALGDMFDDVGTLSRPVVSRVSNCTEVSPFDACWLFYAELSRPPPKTAFASASALEQHRRQQFWAAHNVTDAGPHTKAFAQALEEAVVMQQGIAQATAALTQPQAVVTVKDMCYAVLGTRGGQKVFEEYWCPIRLRLLVKHAARALAATKGKIRPFVAACAQPAGVDGALSSRYTALCSEPRSSGPLVVERVISEFHAARADVQDAAAVESDTISPLACIVHGKENASHYLESLHLRLARSLAR